MVAVRIEDLEALVKGDAEWQRAVAPYARGSCKACASATARDRMEEPCTKSTERGENAYMPGTTMVGFGSSSQLYDPMYLRLPTLIGVSDLSSSSLANAGTENTWRGSGESPSVTSASGRSPGSVFAVD